MRLILVAAIAAALSACGPVKVTTINPRPNINLPKSEQKFRLQLGDAVHDTYKQPGSNKMAAFDVSGWHKSLQNGFKNGFSSSFTVTDAPESDLVLQIEEAEPSFVAAAVSADGNTAAVRAQIRYKANLVDPTGNVLKRLAGTVESKSSASDVAQAGHVVEGAVESMYEDIVAKAFAG